MPLNPIHLYVYLFIQSNVFLTSFLIFTHSRSTVEMQKQAFMFNPMQMGSPRSAQQSSQIRDEIIGDFAHNDSRNRTQRVLMQNARKEHEPLLLSSAQKIQQHQEQETKAIKSGERLANLHSQLYQQTEKLKQWKINTEIQISDKDRKITEASKTIESLRKSILELQFLNESVSSRLQEEKTLQEEAVQKIGTTRNMCNALKKHLVKLESGVVMGETMLETQRQEAQQKVDQYEELTLRFQELEIKVIGREHEMEKEATRNHNKQKEQIEGLQEKLRESDGNVVCLRQINQVHEGEMRKISQELTIAKEENERVRNEYTELQEHLSQANKAVKEYDLLIQEEKKSSEKLIQEYQEAEQRYTIQVTNLENACKDRDEEIRTQEKDLLEKSKDLFKAEARIKQLLETIESKDLEIEELLAKTAKLECAKSKLETDVTDYESKVKVLEEIIKELELSVTRYKDTELLLNNRAENEKEAANGLREKIKLLEEQVGQAKKDRIELKDLNDKVQELEASREELQFQANFALSQIEETTSQLQVLASEKQTLAKKLEENNSELQQQQEKHAKTIAKIEDLETLLRERDKEISTKSDEVKLLQSKFDEICQERASDQGILEEIMGSRDKKIATSETKIKTLEDKLTVKVKQISKFQAEIKSLKAQLKKQEKLTTKQENDIASAQEMLEKYEKVKSDELEVLKEKETKLLNDVQQAHMTASEKEKSMEVLTVEMERLKNQVEMSQQQNEKAQQELKEAKQGFDSQIAEMCNTLEKYKVENEKLINAKEKELDIKTKEVLNSNKKLKEAVQAKGTEIKKLSETITEKEEKIVQLESEIEQIMSKLSDLGTHTNAKMRSDIEMVDTEEKAAKIAGTVVKRSGKGDPIDESQIMDNKFVNRAYNTPQMATPASTPQGTSRKSYKYLIKDVGQVFYNQLKVRMVTQIKTQNVSKLYCSL